jgi:Flp pilus assembly protein TadG
VTPGAHANTMDGIMTRKTIASALKVFARDSRANISMFFSLAAVPVLIGAGMAVDYSRLTVANGDLQSAVDAAALAAANAYAAGQTNYEAIADDQLFSNLATSVDLVNNQIETEVVVDTVADTLTLKAKTSIPTSFMVLAGLDEMQLFNDRANGDDGVTSTVTLPIFSDHRKGEIVLVMDYSSSMNEYVGSERKYKTMRAEAAELVESLSQDGTNTDVKFGLVPFSHAVRVTMPRQYFYDYTGTTNMTSCIEDRRSPYNLESSTPNTSTSKNSTKFRTTSCTNFSSNSLNVRPLTISHAGTISQIQDMVPYGNTHIALGLETAWHLLTAEAPFSQAVAPNDETLKAVVLLTDGQQTSPGYGPGGAWSVAQAEANTTSLCASMKTWGIRVITVSFDLNDEATETRLRNCASEDEDGNKYFYDADTNQELADAFGVIRDSLARNMYLSD